MQLSISGDIEFSDLSFETRRLAVSTFHFPEWRTLVDDDRLEDSLYTDSSELPPEYLLPIDSAGYDPSFILAATFHWLTAASITAVHIIEAGILPLILRCLGSADPSMRMISIECLHLLEVDADPGNDRKKANVPADHIRSSCKEMKQLRYSTCFQPSPCDQVSILFQFLEHCCRFLLSWVRNSFTKPGLEKLTAVHALFVAEASLALLSPGSVAYSIIYKYMLRSPFMDRAQLPLRRQVLLSATHEDRFLKTWYFMLLLGGLRSSQDVSIYEKSHIFEMMMHTIDFGCKTRDVSDIEFGIIYRACQIPKSARLLASSGGAMGWFTRRIIYEMYNSLSSTEILGNGVLASLSAWKTLCSWKGVTRRGSDRDRRQAMRDFQSSTRTLNLAKTMLEANLKISDAVFAQVDETVSHLDSKLIKAKQSNY